MTRGVLLNKSLERTTMLEHEPQDSEVPTPTPSWVRLIHQNLKGQRVFASKRFTESGDPLAECVHGRSGWLADGTMLYFCNKSQPTVWCTEDEFKARKAKRRVAHRRAHWECKKARGANRHGSRGAVWPLGCYALG